MWGLFGRHRKGTRKYLPILLCATKLAQSTSQYHFPSLLHATKLGQSTSQHYFVCQNLHKVRPSIIWYYNACSCKINVSLGVFLQPDLKIDVSCEASVDFHLIQQNATPATEFAPCNTLRSADNATRKKQAKITAHYYFALLNLHKASQYYYKVRPSTTSYYKTCTKYFSVPLRTTKVAQSASQYYFVLQSLRKALPGSTSYYKTCTITSNDKTCTKYFPLLLRIRKLAQITSQYYFVLQSLHKTLPSTTWYYKTCTRYVPVLLRIAKHAQITSKYYFVQQNLHKVLPSTILESWHKVSQYYFVPQGLHKVFPSTTSYYKACTKYVPILLPNTAQKKASRRMGLQLPP